MGVNQGAQKPGGFDEFDRLARKLAQVPKDEAKAAEKAERAQKRRKATSKKK